MKGWRKPTTPRAMARPRATGTRAMGMTRTVLWNSHRANIRAAMTRPMTLKNSSRVRSWMVSMRGVGPVR